MKLSRADLDASLEADIDALPRARRNARRGAVRADFDIPIAPFSAIRAAANGRRLSTMAYIKRAAYAMAAADLGLSVTDLLALDPRVARENGFAVEDPAGTKFGSWDVEVRDGTER